MKSAPELNPTTPRASPIDIMDEVLRPLLGSVPATSAAVSCFLALQRGGWLLNVREGAKNDE